jgi:holin-like protein
MLKAPDSSAKSTKRVSLFSRAKTPVATVCTVPWRSWIELACGFLVLVLSLLTGEQIKSWLHQPIPGNVLGLFLLLICFRLRLISPRLVEQASDRLLFVLPALFIPIYVSAIGQGQLWSKLGWFLLPALLAATAGLWIFVGHLAQILLRCSSRHE